MTPEQSYGKYYVTQILPCLPNEIIEHPHFFVFAIDVTVLTFIISFASIVITLQCIYFFSRTLIYLSSRKAKSQRTYKLQLQFFIAFSIQIIIPTCAIIAPVCHIAFACATSYFDQAFNNIFVNVIAVHGLISSVVMLRVHKPHWQAVLGMDKCAYLDKKLMGSSIHVEGTTTVVLSSKRPSINPQVYIGPGHNYLPVDYKIELFFFEKKYTF
ncbi:Protein CBG06518 [Caenorhabditis briggsae]|uniref:Protein CBG06518 n=1 Tax=Caenorhabditis briggsae TaxID=6238 RepID=A8X2F1_CAEBR|nr:Protein CBG06518 [Caenorhabditis briggsae]CAP26811.2 Protein CBG06518 [Caenorhabditis briggsae]